MGEKTPFKVEHPKLDAMAAELKAIKEMRKIKAEQWKGMSDGFENVKDFIESGGLEEALVEPIKNARARIEDEMAGALSPITSAFDVMLQDVINMFNPVWEAISLGATTYVNEMNNNLQELQRRAHANFENLLSIQSRMQSMKTWEEMKGTEEYQQQYADYMWEVEAKKRGTRGNLEW